MDESELASLLSEVGLELRAVRPLPGDVSIRRYARLELEGAKSAIAAGYPAELAEACGRFERTTELLESAGIRVPRILASDCERGLMLVEDLGPETLFDRRSLPIAERLPFFERAVDSIHGIRQLDAGAVASLNPPLDRKLLRRELEQTIELYLAPRRLLGEATGAANGVVDAFERLCRALGEATPEPCHRDFMARNLIPLRLDAREPAVGVLDHQDLRLGPPAYDLASLLNDSFFPSPDVEARLTLRAGLAAEQEVHYHRAALQRTLKAIGTFAAFAARGSERHLPLVAPTLERARLHLRQVPEMAEVAATLEPAWARHVGELA